MIRVGVTGGIGSGKSTVCRLFAERGVPVYDSDSEAKRLMGEDPSLRAALVEAFGDETFRDGVLNRRYLAATVFGDGRALARLEALVPPGVKRDFERWAAERIAEPYVVLECAILYESGMDAAVDRVVAVVAPEELRLVRVNARDGASAQHQCGGGDSPPRGRAALPGRAERTGRLYHCQYQQGGFGRRCGRGRPSIPL